MSLDVSLKLLTPVLKRGTGVFIRENGQNKELTVEEVMEKFPHAVVNEKEYESETVFHANITHNLTHMARACGVYEACWYPEEINAIKAKDIIQILEDGYNRLVAKPDYYKTFDSDNGWGTYNDFVPWIKNYLDACIRFPDAIIEVDK